MRFAGKITAVVALTGALALASATPSQARWWGGWGGWGWGGPVAAGIGLGLAGAALASAAVAGPFWGGYGYGYPAYAGYGWGYGSGWPGYASYGYGPGVYASAGFGPSYVGTTWVRRSYAFAPRRTFIRRSYAFVPRRTFIRRSYVFAPRGARSFAAVRTFRSGRAFVTASPRRAYGMVNGNRRFTTNIAGISPRMRRMETTMPAGRMQTVRSSQANAMPTGTAMQGRATGPSASARSAPRQ
jgi:hypothetical protein